MRRISFVSLTTALMAVLCTGFSSWKIEEKEENGRAGAGEACTGNGDILIFKRK